MVNNYISNDLILISILKTYSCFLIRYSGIFLYVFWKHILTCKSYYYLITFPLRTILNYSWLGLYIKKYLNYNIILYFTVIWSTKIHI